MDISMEKRLNDARIEKTLKLRLSYRSNGKHYWYSFLSIFGMGGWYKENWIISNQKVTQPVSVLGRSSSSEHILK